jgi:tocopherol O-methyltransferase
MASSTAQAPATAPPGLKEGIAGLYDESSGLWENIWGDHMHHGFYDSSEAASMADHRRAQIRMIEEALAFAGVPASGASTPVSWSYIVMRIGLRLARVHSGLS